MAPPSKLTPAVSAAVAGAIAKGATAKEAATRAGIDEATLHRWLGRGRAGREPYAEFAQRVASARSEYEEEVEAQWRRRWEERLRMYDARVELAVDATLDRIRIRSMNA